MHITSTRGRKDLCLPAAKLLRGREMCSHLGVRDAVTQVQQPSCCRKSLQAVCNLSKLQPTDL